MPSISEAPFTRLRGQYGATNVHRRGVTDQVDAGLTLLSHLMDDVLLILADVFDQVGIRNRIEINLERPGSRVHFGIIDCAFHLQMPRSEALESFCHAQFLRMRQPQAIKP